MIEHAPSYTASATQLFLCMAPRSGHFAAKIFCQSIFFSTDNVFSRKMAWANFFLLKNFSADIVFARNIPLFDFGHTLWAHGVWSLGTWICLSLFPPLMLSKVS